MGRFCILALLCAACARGSHAGAAGAFAITYPDAPPSGVKARLGKRFYAKPAAQCFYDNGREASWRMTGARVTAGELPPGLALEDGVIGGTPKHAGSYQATIEFSEVTCAGKPSPGQVVDVQITVQ